MPSKNALLPYPWDKGLASLTWHCSSLSFFLALPEALLLFSSWLW